MIAIDDILVSDQLVEEQFVCDLEKCKGGCCVDGDAGAPLEQEELKELDRVYGSVAPYLSEEAKLIIETQGKYVYDREFGWVTPTVSNGMCAYGLVNDRGIVQCAIERACIEGVIEWKKPVSCHLFPARIKKTRRGELVNYEPREGLCAAACSLGRHLKMPVYRFLEEPLVRKYGREFYEALDATAAHLEASK